MPETKSKVHKKPGCVRYSLEFLAQVIRNSLRLEKCMNTLLKIDSIMIYVSSLERAAKFYEEALGLKRAWTDMEHGMIGFLFKEGDSEIVIHNDHSMKNPSFSLLVENVEKFCIDYLKKGHTIVKEPFEVRCGKYAILADPDGNELPIIDLTKFGSKPKYNSS